VDILTGAVTTQAASHRTWVAKVRGERRGGGVALRITRSSPDATPGPRVAQEGSAGLADPTSKAPVDPGVGLDRALHAMREAAGQRHIGGVAVVAYFRGRTPDAWISRMSVVGRYKDAPSAGQAGANLLAIAYAKASEMADTLQDSGNAGRPTMTGEVGWKGGVVSVWNGGFLIAAFSGGKSEDDVEVSRAGIAAATAEP
jgi:hypothetical protein